MVFRVYTTCFTNYRPIGDCVYSEITATRRMFLLTLLVIPPGMGLIELLLRASNEGLLRPRVARAQKLNQVPSPPLLFILSIELRDHLIGQVQLRLIIEDDPHGRLVPLVDDRHISVRFDYGLRSRLHFS